MKQLIAVCGLASFLSSAFAGSMGDIGRESSFNGAYAGLGSGFSTFFVDDSHTTTLSSPVISRTQKTHGTDTSVMFEGHLGYGQSVFERFYLGGKGSVFYTPINYLKQATNSITNGTVVTINNNHNQISLKPLYNIDAVLGYELSTHWLPFIEGGLSITNVDSNNQQDSVQMNFAGSNYEFISSLNSKGYNVNYNLGAGLSYKIQDRLLLSAELVYNYLGRYSSTSSTVVPSGSETVSYNRTFQLTSLFATASYLFPV
ncbi:MAG: hypothetical protein CK426_09325 [Legionella sp.]|nr:hypothetical protein [Chitinophaga sp.]PJD95426.1 MAG: hypothetical protein CK426_09325 [Legionella sp.]